MALSVDTADQIVDIVSNDIVCCSCIEGPTGWGLFSALEWAGGVRNIFLMIGGLQPADKAFIRVTCTGIAEATVAAIYQAAMVDHSLPGVVNAYFWTRVVYGFHHNATMVKMEDGSAYIFDWWRTMDPGNPVMYKLFDWQRGRSGVQYEDFTGF
jgi:hypothetical protein